MAPKRKAVSELGTVAEHGNGWRAWVKLGCDRVVFGPTHYGRAGRREAEADLAQARQASTREEMQSCLQNLRDGAARAAMPSAATSGVAQSAAGTPPLQGRTQSSDSSGVEQPAAIQGPRHAPANCVRGAESQNLFPGSVGIHHAADTTDINFEHCQEFLERQQEHIATFKSMLPDVKTRPSDSRIGELAEGLKVP